MAAKSKIEWTDATWQPITGCSVVSPGCTNCYAMRLAGTRLRNHPSRAGLTTMAKAGPVWSGKVRLNTEWLTDPLRWKRPRMIFVCAHGDLFHESVPDDWIDRVFAVMALCPQHTFQVLTKRAERMRAYLAKAPDVYSERWHHVADEALDIDPALLTGEGGWAWELPKRWPLPNIWLGVSAERQQEADERIPLLLDTPAAVRFVSLEPLLGPIKFRPYTLTGRPCFVCRSEDDLKKLRGTFSHPINCGWRQDILRDEARPDARLSSIDLVITGGESGPHARPMNPQWARDIRDRCAGEGTPFFHKQNGEYASVSEVEGAGAHFQFPDGRTVRRVGKKKAGRMLDGVEHSALPPHAQTDRHGAAA